MEENRDRKWAEWVVSWLKRGGVFAYLDVGAFIALTIAVIATWGVDSPSLNAEIVVLLSSLVAAAYHGMGGALLVTLVYSIPVGFMHYQNGASGAEWAILIAKMGFILMGAFVASRITKKVWRELRANRTRLSVLQRELRRLRKAQEASEEIAKQIGTGDILNCAVKHTLEILKASGAAWLLRGERVEQGFAGEWPEHLTSELIREPQHPEPWSFYDSGCNILAVTFPVGVSGSGVLAVAIRGPRRQYRAAFHFLECIANCVSAALAKSRVLEAHRTQADYLTLLNELGRRFASNLGLEDLFDTMYKEVSRVMDSGAFFVALYDEEQTEVELRYVYDAGKRQEPVKYILNDGPTSRAIKTRRPVLHNIDGRNIPGVMVIGDTSEVVQSMLVVPIILQEKVIGALSAQSYKPNAYTEEHVRILSIIANQAAMALDNAKLYEKTLSMAMTDSMTGLGNARALHQAMDQVMSKARIYRTEVSLIMLDSDSLKHINDKFGHLAGDEHICSLGEVVKNNVRTRDIVARYAGDEFMVLLPDTNAEDARVIAQRIVQAVRQIEHRSGFCSIMVTASAGVATYPQDADNVEDLIRAADAAMYRAKHAGKDRVYCTGDEIVKTAGA